jgi:ABC-2 type transport system permease protein
MNKFWRVVQHEYARHVLRRRFVFSLLSVPALLAMMVVVGMLVASAQSDSRPAGYVDHAGLLANPLQPTRQPDRFSRVDLLPFPTEAAAEAALRTGEIQAYFVLPPDHLQTGKLLVFTYGDLNGTALTRFQELVRLNLLADENPAVRERILSGPDLVVQEPDGSRSMGQDDWLNMMLPYVVGLAFMVAMFTSSGYLMQAVVEEKENRTIEVLVTSVTPMQLMGGKVVGLLGVGLTQLLAWLAAFVAAILIGQRFFPFLATVRLSWEMAALMLVTILPGYLLLSGLMAAVGATVTDLREAQQLTGLFILPVVSPYWFAVPIMEHPNGPLATALSLFPLTAPVTMSMRVGFATIPAWQIGLSVALLVLSAWGALWLAARTFRVGMLQYGKRLSLRQIFAGGSR